MESCRNIIKKLSAYQDGEATTTEKAAIENHLSTCEVCRMKYEALLRTYRILRDLPEIEPAPGLSRQIVNRATQAQEPFWVQIFGSAFRSLPASIAMVILAAAGLLIGAIMGDFLTARQFHPSWESSAFQSDQALTLAAVRVFDATPPGSFAEGYLKLTAYNPETGHAK
jgi:anti-sigma factor RsiW